MSTSVRITVAEYDRMIAEGRFEPREDHHVELLEGEITPMSPINPGHSNAVRELLKWSILNGPLDQVDIQGQDPIDIAELDSVPQPDIVWIRRGNYRRKRPTSADVLLLIEVSDSSLAEDRGRKARIYAEAGIADYWIVNVREETIEVRRDPEGGVFRSVTTHRPGESVPLLALPEIAFPVAILFPEDEADDETAGAAG
jgi:Uma2 family endonuclease